MCKVEEVNVHCYCRCPDYGVTMVFCDGVCGERFHIKCIESPVQSNRNWYCKKCVKFILTLISFLVFFNL